MDDNIKMTQVISFDKLSHVEYLPSEFVCEPAFKKGEKICRYNIFNKPKDTGEVYDESWYDFGDGDESGDYYTPKSELEHKFAFDDQDNVYTLPRVVLHFMNGETYAKRFDTATDALEFYKKFQMANTLTIN